MTTTASSASPGSCSPSGRCSSSPFPGYRCARPTIRNRSCSPSRWPGCCSKTSLPHHRRRPKNNPPPPPPPPVKMKPDPVVKTPPVEHQVATNKPEPAKPPARRPEPPRKVALNKEAPVPEARVPVPDKPPGEIDAARRKVAGVGLLAMKDDIQELHGASTAVQLA